MTEDEAIAWAEARIDPASMARLRRFAAIVTDENTRQNLISPATIATIWSRHIVDSLQLVALAHPRGRWLDIGTGGGFPGLVIAAAGWTPVTLVEPRRRRADFLRQSADELGLVDVEVFAGKVEQVGSTALTISARAVATMGNLLRAAAHCATPETRWLLPRGTIDRAEIAATARQHGMMFHVEQSVTQVESSIVIMEAR